MTANDLDVKLAACQRLDKQVQKLCLILALTVCFIK